MWSGASFPSLCRGTWWPVSIHSYPDGACWGLGLSHLGLVTELWVVSRTKLSTSFRDWYRAKLSTTVRRQRKGCLLSPAVPPHTARRMAGTRAVWQWSPQLHLSGRVVSIHISSMLKWINSKNKGHELNTLSFHDTHTHTNKQKKKIQGLAIHFDCDLNGI